MEGKCVVFLQQNLWGAVTGSTNRTTKMLEGTLNKLRLVGNALHEGFIQRFSKGWPCRGLLRGGVV
jgi:hypothetical protein